MSYEISFSITALCPSCGKELPSNSYLTKSKSMGHPLDKDNPYERKDRLVYITPCADCLFSVETLKTQKRRLTMAEHKHAAVLRAIADGKAVELTMCAPGGWIAPPKSINPLSHPEFEWRIKPEPKPDSVHISRIALRPTSNGPQTALVNLFDTDGGKVQYTFDGETGKLKSAEVLP